MGTLKQEMEKSKQLFEKSKNENKAVRFTRLFFAGLIFLFVIVIGGSALYQLLLPLIVGTVKATM